MFVDGAGGGGGYYPSTTTSATGTPQVMITPLRPPPSCANVSASTAPGGSTVTVLSCWVAFGAAPVYAIGGAPAHGTRSPLSPTNGLVS